MTKQPKVAIYARVTPKRRRSNDVSILAEDGKRKLLKESTLSGPLIGIWWENQDRIVAILQRPNNASGGTSLSDSDFLDADEWPRIAHYFNKTPEVDDFVIPRGRVLFDRDQGIGILYHGNATGENRLREIAARFGLANWKARTDEHYLMGDAIDDLFGQE